MSEKNDIHTINLGVRVFILIICTLIAVSISAEPDDSVPFVVSGVVVNSGSAELVSRFVNKLSADSGYLMKPVYVKTYTELSQILRENPLSIGWTCGAPYVEDKIKDGQQLVGVPLFNEKPLYSSLIISRKDSHKNSLLDYKGKIFAYSDPRSNSGFIAPSYHLKLQGIDIKKHFRLLLHAGNHERSIEAMAHGLADVAAIDEYVWVDYIKKHPEVSATLHEIERIGPFPFTPIVAGRQVNKDVIRKLQTTLLNFDKNSKGKELLDSFGLDGFVVKEPDFYQPIQNMMEELDRPLK